VQKKVYADNWVEEERKKESIKENRNKNKVIRRASI
jgi:hypothetical protein